MSAATLNIWITNLGDPCTVANDTHSGLPHAWVVAISHCDGRVVDWSEGRYRFHRDDPWTPIPYHTPAGGTPGWWYEMIPTRDGHVEVELPPGSYVVRGTMHSWFINRLLYGNWATERAVVHLGCGQAGCATLYAPSAPACWILLFEFVLPLLVRHRILDREPAAKVAEALRSTLKLEAASTFEREEFETLRRAYESMEKPSSTKEAAS